MINKKKALHLLKDYGDAVVDLYGEEPVVVTTDFNNKYIRSIRRTTRFSLKGKILVFNWTKNEYDAIPLKSIRNISPLSSILGNSNG